MSATPPSPAPVLVAGGLGLLGSAVAELLRTNGTEVVVADLFADSGDGVVVKAERAEKLRAAGATIVRIDLTDARSVGEILAELRPEAVVNAALFPEEGPGLAPFLGALRGSTVRYAVHLSDAALYGPPPSPGARAREDDPNGPCDSAYLRQRASEELLVSSSGLPFTILRLFHLLGASFPAGRFPADAVAALRRGEEVHLADDAPRDFVHLADAARAVRLALEKRPQRATVNVGSGLDVRPSDILLALSVRLSVPFRFLPDGPPATSPRIADTTAAWDLLGFATQRGIGGAVEELSREGRGEPGDQAFSPRFAFTPVPDAATLVPQATPAPEPVSRRELFNIFRRPFDRRR